MEIKLIRKGGVPKSEISAHQAVEAAFNKSRFSSRWRGYAAFQLTKQRGSGEEDFDLVLVTHSCIAVLELKNWQGKLLEKIGPNWYVDGEDRGESPVRLAQDKAKRLASRLKEKLGPHRTPFVNFFVVIQDGIDETNLGDDDRSVISLGDLVAWVDEREYKKFLPWSAKFDVLAHLSLYDKFFGGSDVKPRDYLVQGFRPQPDAIWVHPKGLYSEFKAQAKDDPDKLALLRRWDFSKLGTSLIGENARSFLGLREQAVYEYVSDRNPELQAALLRPITRRAEKDVTYDFEELYALPPKLTRLTEFAYNSLPKLDSDDRVILVKALLSRFADLHDLSVAHRDVSDQTLWVERPARVIMTGFPAAYFPSMKTVGTFRDQVKVENSKLPEDTGVVTELTPYRRDVFLLGVTCHLILFGERPPKVAEVFQWSPRANESYGGAFDAIFDKALSSDPADRFENARAMLGAVNAATASNKPEIIDLSRFDAFKAITKERDYDQLQVFRDDDDSLFYRSQSDGRDVAIKCWFGVEPDTRRQDNAVRLLVFLERARILRGCFIPGLCRVMDFGLSRRDLLLVREWVNGLTLHEWLATDPDLGARVRVSQALADTLERLHALELPHGDVHPGNVIIANDGQPFLIDILDFERGVQGAYTTAYLPQEYKTMSPIERDHYGLAAVITELLGGTQAQPVGPYPVSKVYELLTRLLTVREASALEPLQKALANALEQPAKEKALFTVSVKGLGFRQVPEGPMYLDNGCLRIKLEASQRTKGVFVRLTGVGRQLAFDWLTEERRAVNVTASNITQVQLIRQQALSDAAVPLDLILKNGPTSDLSELVDYLLSHPAVDFKFRTLTAAPKTSPVQLLVPESENGPVSVSGEASLLGFEAVLPAPLAEIWRALLDAEEGALPMLTVSGIRRPNPSDREQVLVPYHLDSGEIDFRDDDVVEVESRGHDNIWRRCGYLSLRDTTFGDLSELAIESLNAKANLRIGDKLRLHGRLEKASFTRRSVAVQRVLGDRAVVPRLIEYFDPTGGQALQPTRYPEPKDSDLEEYSQGSRKLNESQREAFRRVVSNGPVSLLQGPPGTGKTLFIASLLHYLMTKERARRILLVSQSHEAVNNAMEKALEVCRAKDLTFDAVRLGLESSASDGIRHLHTSSIEQSYREQFKAEKEQRIVELAKTMGLPENFANAFVSLHTLLGGLASGINRAASAIEVMRDADEKKALESRLRSLNVTFENICQRVYSAPYESGPDATIALLEKSLVDEYEIRSPASIQRLRKLVRLSEDWLGALGSPQANFSEFLAKSRTVVAGTLVGIGQRAAGVVQNLYDWVIIDEAGRAAPSELAVAMQTGHRILLVGDHKQLPPTFSEEVKDAIQGRFGVDEDSAIFGSDFERIFESPYGKAVGASLLKQYRMAPNIGKLVSDCFYDKRLDTGRGPAPAYYASLPAHMAQEVTWVDTTPLGEWGHEQQSLSGDAHWNEGEAQVVMRLLRQIVESDEFMEAMRADLHPGEPAIGIICMYGHQRSLLDRLKSEASWLGDARRLVKIDTVDSYQGKENRIIILSTVRNNPRLKYGFLKIPNRTNVALSRAMERLFIVGASAMWSGKNENLPLGKVLSVLQTMQRDGKAAFLSAKEVLE